MLKGILFRVIVGAFIIYSFVFVAVALVPVDPAQLLVGPYAPPDALHEVRQQFGLDRPLFERYWIMLAQILRGNFGNSISYGIPVVEILKDAAIPTMKRVMLAFLSGSALGLLLPLLLYGRLKAETLEILFSTLYAVPAYISFLVVLWLASLLFAWTPSGEPLIFEILSVGIATMYPMGVITSYLVADIDKSQRTSRYVLFFRMVHMSEKKIIKTVWREKLPGAISVILNVIPGVFGAITFSEYIFNLKGFGYLYIEASKNADYPILIAGALLIGMTFLLMQGVSEYIYIKIERRRSYEIG